MRPQDKFVDKAPHLLRQQGSPEVWRRGGDKDPKDALAYDKAIIHKEIQPAEFKKGK